MASLVAARFAASPDLANLLQWYSMNGSSQVRLLYFVVFAMTFADSLIPPTAASQIFDSFVRVQQQAFPEYFEEILGIADGSKQPLLHVLLLNLDEELSYFLPNSTAARATVTNSTAFMFLHFVTFACMFLASVRPLFV